MTAEQTRRNTKSLRRQTTEIRKNKRIKEGSKAQKARKIVLKASIV